jgi:carbamoyltransferase
MYLLGLTTFHDAAAVLVEDGTPVAAVEEERLTRRRHESCFPGNAVRYCLEAAGVPLEAVGCVAVYWRPWFVGRGLHVARSLLNSPSRFRARARQGMENVEHYRRLIGVRRELQHAAGVSGRARFTLRYVDHHLSHAASTFLASPFHEAAILTLDGSGETTASLMAQGSGTRIRSLRRIRLPHSLGHLYATITRFLGFRKNWDEGKVMALASYGDPTRFEKTFARIVSLTEEGGYRIDSSTVDQYGSRWGEWPDRLIADLGAPRRPDDPLDERHSDIAAALQDALERTALHMTRHLAKVSRSRKLCLAGGVALNCSMNGRLLSESPFDEVFVQPAANDAGASLGAALHEYWRGRTGERSYVMEHAYLGPAFTQEQSRHALERFGCRWTRPADICASCAELLARGRIVGWFQGSMEFGPRALGHRSILGDPRDPSLPARLNREVKHREEFRPFAPSVLEERAGDYFDRKQPSPFMLMVHQVRPEKRAVVPAITHVDGSARVQTVSRANGGIYRRLIEAFDRITGIPMVLNTSFNDRGEPIVCSPEEAIQCFRGTRLDALVLGDFLVERD